MPGTISSKPTRNPNKRRNLNGESQTNVESLENYKELYQTSPEERDDTVAPQGADDPAEKQTNQRVRKKVKVRL